ncbi:hypothetical protein B0T22DRAFT_218119 [Podospora appendiculata]|uniref:Uncharacterized protein n=1 Tax=Podospora appendiculata TaxID=314037 RepID=A0AAE0X532_9PEZI|nr:hypothetical protein B0T22DRAFT_218119 [Podospora appendiculata]
MAGTLVMTPLHKQSHDNISRRHPTNPEIPSRRRFQRFWFDLISAVRAAYPGPKGSRFSKRNQTLSLGHLISLTYCHHAQRAASCSVPAKERPIRGSPNGVHLLLPSIQLLVANGLPYLHRQGSCPTWTPSFPFVARAWGLIPTEPGDSSSAAPGQKSCDCQLRCWLQQQAHIGVVTDECDGRGVPASWLRVTRLDCCTSLDSAFRRKPFVFHFGNQQLVAIIASLLVRVIAESIAFVVDLFNQPADDSNSMFPDQGTPMCRRNSGRPRDAHDLFNTRMDAGHGKEREGRPGTGGVSETRERWGGISVNLHYTTLHTDIIIAVDFIPLLLTRSSPTDHRSVEEGRTLIFISTEPDEPGSS